MKKILIGLMALVLCFTLASCGNKTDEKNAVDTGSANVENAENIVKLFLYLTDKLAYKIIFIMSHIITIIQILKLFMH